MAERYLIDTSAVIKYLNGSLPMSRLGFLDEIVDQEPMISFITEIELQVWSPLRAEDLQIYKEFISNCYIFSVDNNIISETIRIRKEYGLKIPDAMIAATALVNGLVLIADNDKDFVKVPELRYINPTK